MKFKRSDTLSSYFASLVERYQFVERDPVFNDNADENAAPVKQEGASSKAGGGSQQDEEEGQDGTAIVGKDFDKEKTRPTMQVIRKYIQ